MAARGRLLLGTLLALAVASCSPRASEHFPASSAVTIQTVVVGFTTDPGPLPFDPHGARLVQASQQLTQLAGHDISLQFDVALLPAWRPSFEAALTDAIETLARSLDAIRSTQSEAFAYAVTRLRQVDVRYAAVPPHDAVTFDAAAGTLRIEITSEANALLPSFGVVQALRDAWRDSLDVRFAQVEPEKADDASLYLRWLLMTWSHSHPVARAAPDQIASDPRALLIARAVHLFERLPPSTQRDAPYQLARAWLAERVSYFADAYQDHEAAATGAPAGSPFWKAESAWVAWLHANFDKLDDRQRFQIIRHLAVERRGGRDSGSGRPRYVAGAFPGVDFVGYALKIADEWAAAGYPMRADEHADRHLLFLFAVCPGPRDSSGHHTSFFACDHVTYRYAIESVAGSKRLADYLLARRDAKLAEASFVNFTHMPEAYASMLSLWRALEADPAQWRIAASVIAEQARYIPEKALLLDEAQRLWRELPSQRGSVLYLLGRLQVERYGTVDWNGFVRIFGARATRADFEGFLDGGDDAMAMTGEVWGALGAGWSRAAAIVPRLDRYLDGLRATQQTAAGARCLDDIVSHLCTEHASADVAQVHAYVERRAASHASEAQDLEPVLYHSKPERCAEAAASAKARNERGQREPGQPVLFGD